MNRQPISTVIITLNCGEILEKALESVKWCDEIVIVDSGSTDKTLEICKKYNCKIYHHPFEGFGKQKKYAVELAKHDWILSIDGDEIITGALRAEIESILSSPKIEVQGFYLPITLVFLNKVFHFGNENKKLHLRFFNKTFGNFNEASVHEGVQLSGKTGNLKNEILHYSYINVHHYFDKFNSYTSRFVEDALKKGKKASIPTIMFRSIIDFLKLYFLKGNFMNGYAGFVWSVLSAQYTFVKYVKLRESLKK